MPDNIFFTPLELAEEINHGESSVRFWLNRFSPWFVHKVDRGQKLYAKESIATLLMISDKIDQGMIPTQIETLLEDRTSTDQQKAEKKTKKATIHETNNKSLEMIQSILGTITSQQERIATAQERRAEAEEQKARAMDKRAVAEEQKALAMNAIAKALGRISHGTSGIEAPKDSMPENFLIEATQALGLDQIIDNNINMDQDQTPGPHEPVPSDGDLLKDTDDLSTLVDDEPELDDLDMKDLSALLKDEPVQEFGFKDLNLDDLSLLVNEEQEKPLDDLNLLIDPEQAEPLDDLNLFLDNEDQVPLDNLSLLLDDEDKVALDDLNLLVNDENQEHLDDLSQLVDDEDQNTLDDLNLLVDDENREQKEDFSLPVEVEEKETVSPDDGYPGLDNLGMLVEEKEEDLGIKPTITPEENFEQYKSEIINIIIQLKSQGLNVDETTERFNSEGVLTLSGKPRWSTRAIDQIYSFIDAVKK